MQRIFFVAIFCLSSLATGCYAPRSFDPLPKEHWPEKATAILPVTIASIQNDNPDISSEKVAKIANAVLDTVTTGTNNLIIGPSKFVSIIEDEHSLRRIRECLNAPLGETWNIQALSEFSKRIGIENIVLINIIVYYPSSRDVSDEISFRGTKEFGDVVVNAELIVLNPISTRITNRSSGKAEYWSTKGWAGGGAPGGFAIVPVLYGKTFGKAVDQATRDSLEHLFKDESEPKDRFIEHLSGLVRDEKTGLEWFAGPDKDTTLNEAKSWVENLSVEGGGWRLPTFEELITLNPWKPGRCSITKSLNTSGWWIWASSPSYGEYYYSKESFSKVSLFNCFESSKCCDSFNKTRCFAVRYK